MVRTLSCKGALIQRYRQYLSVNDRTPIISLGEGNTPLAQATNLPKHLGFPLLHLFFKLEGLNPTGSFKDRGMTLAISKAVELGTRAIVCASTGNTSASAAAFAAKAGLRCYVIIPKGQVTPGKISQALMYGARPIEIEGDFDQTLKLVQKLAADCEFTLVNASNPYRIEGQKTAALEVVEQLGQAPDFLLIPAGNSDNICAYWRGFKIAKEFNMATRVPRILAFESEYSAEAVGEISIDDADTVDAAMRAGDLFNWKEASSAVEESKGRFDFVSDEEILEAYQLVARTEGIFCSPSSAIGIAGLIKSLKSGYLPGNSVVACVLTGNGLKDLNTATQLSKQQIPMVRANLERLKRTIRVC